MSAMEAFAATTSMDAEAAITELFDAHCDFVCRTLRRLGVEESTLDDAVQDVFVTAYRRWSSFEGRSSPRTWLFGIARRIAFRHRRRARARPDTSPPGATTVVAHDPVARQDAAHSLAALLAGLDRDKRAVFVLTELEGMTAPEVSEALGIPVGTAYSRLRAAWQRLGHEAAHEQDRLRARLRGLAPPPEPPDRRRRMWGAIATSIAASPVVPLLASGSVGWLGTAKWLFVGAAIAVGFVGARLAADSPAASSRSPAASPSASQVAPAEISPASPSAASGPHPEIPAAPTPAAIPAPIATPATAAPPRAPRRVARPDPSNAPANKAPANGLQAELALVTAARRALARNRPSDALLHLDAHARRFARGQLATERETIRVEALCATGRIEAAERAARAIGNARPDVCTD